MGSQSSESVMAVRYNKKKVGDKSLLKERKTTFPGIFCRQEYVPHNRQRPSSSLTDRGRQSHVRLTERRISYSLTSEACHNRRLSMWTASVYLPLKNTPKHPRISLPDHKRRVQRPVTRRVPQVTTGNNRDVPITSNAKKRKFTNPELWTSGTSGLISIVRRKKKCNLRSPPSKLYLQ